MEMLINNRYKLYNIDKQRLKNLGCRYNKNLSDSEEEFYTYRFQTDSNITGEISISLLNGDVRINAFNGKSSYAPFYDKDCIPAYETMIKEINDKFRYSFRKLGIKKVGEK